MEREDKAVAVLALGMAAASGILLWVMTRENVSGTLHGPDIEREREVLGEAELDSVVGTIVSREVSGEGESPGVVSLAPAPSSSPSPGVYLIDAAYAPTTENYERCVRQSLVLGLASQRFELDDEEYDWLLRVYPEHAPSLAVWSEGGRLDEHGYFMLEDIPFPVEARQAFAAFQGLRELWVIEEYHGDVSEEVESALGVSKAAFWGSLPSEWRFIRDVGLLATD